jgi:hypothetical protein
MGITPPDHMDGRVLHEILTDGHDPDDVAVEQHSHPVSVSYPDGFTYQTKLITLSVGSTHYIREARTERSVSEE